MKNFFKPTKITWWMFGILCILALFPYVWIFRPNTPEILPSMSLFWVLHRFISPLFFPGLSVFHFTFYRILGYFYGFNPDTDSGTLLQHTLVFSITQIFVLVVYSYFVASLISFLWYKFRPKPKLPETG
jgi:hypothetical protein